MTSSNPHYLPGALAPNNITLGVRALACEFQGVVYNLVQNTMSPHFRDCHSSSPS